MASAIDRYKRGIAMGRTPTYDIKGNIRGFRTVPGAAQSEADVVRDPNTGFTPKVTWQRQFGRRDSQPPTPPPVAPAPASPGSLTTDTTQMPPPGAFSEPIKFGLAPDLAGVPPGGAADMASITPRPGTAAFDPNAAYNSAVARNRAVLAAHQATNPNAAYNPDPGYKVVSSPFGGAGKGVVGKYGYGYSQSSAEAAAERSRNAEKYNSSLDVMLGGLYA